MPSNVRVRFAPSPTGYLHVGGARTALFNFLFARHHQGIFLLRIEDTDQKRFQQDAMNEIFESLKWMGLRWDEGPDIKGDYGPYIQSERLHQYREHAERLIENRTAYRCFCTPERLADLRKKQKESNMQGGLGYDRTCLHLSDDKIKNLLDRKKPFVVRFKVPDEQMVAFNDLIRGKIEYHSSILDDFVLLKSDGFPTYHLANVLDDHYMNISHIMRGDEWIASTPKHILLYRAFGWELPLFAHMPVILSQDGGKLSKRKGAASVMDFKKAGYLPEALLNFLALLGWSPGDDREIMTLEEMIGLFDLGKVSPKAAVFDEKKLEWMNGYYLREHDVESFLEDVILRWRNLSFFDSNREPERSYCRDVVRLLKNRSKTINEIAERSAYFFRDPDEYEPKTARKHFRAETIPFLKGIMEKMELSSNFNHENLEKVFREYAEELNISPGKLIHPVRLAVSGVGFGPGLFELLEILGPETVSRRIKKAILRIEKNDSPDFLMGSKHR
jgi:glutamyl-tRNA synthetase